MQMRANHGTECDANVTQTEYVPTNAPAPGMIGCVFSGFRV